VTDISILPNPNIPNDKGGLGDKRSPAQLRFAPITLIRGGMKGLDNKLHKL